MNQEEIKVVHARTPKIKLHLRSFVHLEERIIIIAFPFPRLGSWVTENITDMLFRMEGVPEFGGDD